MPLSADIFSALMDALMADISVGMQQLECAPIEHYQVQLRRNMRDAADLTGLADLTGTTPCSSRTTLSRAMAVAATRSTGRTYTCGRLPAQFTSTREVGRAVPCRRAAGCWCWCPSAPRQRSTSARRHRSYTPAAATVPAMCAGTLQVLPWPVGVHCQQRRGKAKAGVDHSSRQDSMQQRHLQPLLRRRKIPEGGIMRGVCGGVESSTSRVQRQQRQCAVQACRALQPSHLYWQGPPLAVRFCER